ncbi:MAG: hypothetical protein Q8J78_02165 [Moraxellaceae bacterium]|nr:hypothetical protein [Moraxellaceae bacterium]
MLFAHGRWLKKPGMGVVQPADKRGAKGLSRKAHQESLLIQQLTFLRLTRSCSGSEAITSSRHHPKPFGPLQPILFRLR